MLRKLTVQQLRNKMRAFVDEWKETDRYIVRCYTQVPLLEPKAVEEIRELDTARKALKRAMHMRCASIRATIKKRNTEEG